MVGGFYPTGLETDKVEAYDNSMGKWKTLAPLPQPLNHAAIAALNQKIYVIGGYTGRWSKPLDVNFEYDPEKNNWTKKSPMPTARGAMAATVIKGKIYVVGGAVKSKKNYHHIFWIDQHRCK